MGEWVRGIDTGTNTVKGGRRDGWSNGEKGERHVIICRSSTSPVNPRSRLTWLIKEAIKGPPPEILRERRESGRRTQAREIERGPNGENERRERKEGEYGERECCDLCYCFICHPFLLDSLLRLLHSFSLLCFLLLASHYDLCPTVICRAQIAPIHSTGGSSRRFDRN